MGFKAYVKRRKKKNYNGLFKHYTKNGHFIWVSKLPLSNFPKVFNVDLGEQRGKLFYYVSNNKIHHQADAMEGSKNS